MRRLSYKGLGEPLCFFAFGPAAIGAFFLCHAMPYLNSPAREVLAQHAAVVAPLAVIVGLTTTAILFCSHFHQMEGDLAAGKRSPLVQLGAKRGCQV
jgi:2-carboxy-1,4-naphthoquinone phytyltransferase